MDSKKVKGLNYSGSFYEGIAPILFCSRFFGIFPLNGIRPKVQFSWFSFGSVICLVFLIWDAVIISTFLYSKRNSSLSAGIISTTFFFLMGFLIYGVFLQLARRWVSISTWWTEKEQRFLIAPYVTKSSRKLKTKLIRVAIALAVLATVEHSLFQVSDVYIYARFHSECNVTLRGVDTFFYERFAFMHTYYPGMVPMVLTQCVSLFATAAWNFLDMFIIIISIGITTRFEQLTSALKNHIRNDIPDAISMFKFRMDYIGICEILEYVDKHMGILVLLSAMNNLYFVCSQLLHVFNPLRFLPDVLYYWFSLIYLIGRTFYMFLSAATINESAQKPKRYLHNISQIHWNEESSRLLYQINSTTIALSGMGFFSLTRRLILTMAGSIVTFELVMTQFGNTANNLGSFCG